MAVRRIPAQEITTCDRCGAECTSQNRRRRGGITLQQDALDYQGSAVADGTRKWDLCDGCLSAVESALKVAMDRPGS